MNSEINNVTDLLRTATLNEHQLQQISRLISNMTVENQNKEKTKNFAEKILNTENQKKNRYVKFLESSSVNALIYAPTQVGKSDATREFIQTCFKANVPVIVSTDNKNDQNEQLFHRISSHLSGADVKLMKVSDKSFGDDLKACIQTGMHRFAIFCLDNSAQIEKLIINLTSLVTRHPNEMEMLRKIAIIHDEADQITKDRDTDNICPEQAESHKKWLELINLINLNIGYIDLKRVFVTATPENTIMLYNIDCPDVMKLDIPVGYTGYKDIQCIELEDDLDIRGILENQVARIKSGCTYEAILYCIDRKVVDGHENVMMALAGYLRCVINTYNGNGITTFMRTVSLSKRFEAMLKKDNIPYRRVDQIFTIKHLTIRKFYAMCKKLKEKCVVTIGKDLISRGISYVSEDAYEPLTATTMIYKPGTTMHSVGITQTIGRITGCAMPTLKRRLYAPKDVIDTYNAYNRNQEAYIAQIEKDTKLTKDVIANMTFETFKRNIDRSKLKLKMNMVQDRGHSVAEDDIDTMKRLIDMWWNANTIIGKILKFVYESETGVSEGQLMAFIQTTGSRDPYQMYIHLTRDDKEYKHVFKRDADNVTDLKHDAKAYIGLMG